jgi:hypothetical protein
LCLPLPPGPVDVFHSLLNVNMSLPCMEWSLTMSTIQSYLTSVCKRQVVQVMSQLLCLYHCLQDQWIYSLLSWMWICPCNAWIGVFQQLSLAWPLCEHVSSAGHVTAFVLTTASRTSEYIPFCLECLFKWGVQVMSQLLCLLLPQGPVNAIHHTVHLALHQSRKCVNNY